MQEGVVKFFNETKGFGFITPNEGGREVVVDSSGLLDRIREHDEVSFEIAQGKEGPNAENVQLIYRHFSDLVHPPTKWVVFFMPGPMGKRSFVSISYISGNKPAVMRNFVIVLLLLSSNGLSIAQQYKPTWESIDQRETPQWWSDAKFGIFI